MADKVQRYGQRLDFEDYPVGNCSVKDDGDHVLYSAYVKLETELRNTKSLHADIIDQGRKVQIAASGESKYGAMSAGEYIEWMLGKLEGK